MDKKIVNGICSIIDKYIACFTASGNKTSERKLKRKKKKTKNVNQIV